MSRPKSIVLQCALLAALACSLTCLAVFTLGYQAQRHLLQNAIVRDAEQSVGKMTSFLLGYFFAQGNWIHLEDHQSKLNATPNTLYSYIVGENGRIEVGTSGLRSADIGLSEQAWEPLVKVNLHDVRRIPFTATEALSNRFGGRVRAGEPVTLITAPIIRPSTGLGCGELRVAVIYESIVQPLRELQWILLGMGAGLTALIAFIVWFVTKRRLAPLNAVTSAMHVVATQIEGKIAEGGSEMPSLEPFTVEPNVRWRTQEIENCRSALQSFVSSIERLNRVRAELEVSQSLGRLAAQVAHDIRSPLTALAVVGQDLSMLPEGPRTLLRMAIARIQEIASSLLERGNQSSRRLDRRDAPTCIFSVLETLCGEKRAQSKFHLQVEIRVQRTDASFRAFAQIDPAAFKRAVSNLLDNAIEAIPGPGSVSVSVAEDARYVYIRIEDDGVGIAPDRLTEINDGTAKSKKRTGMALGLAYARQFVQQHYGTLSIESVVNRGTVVTIALPRTDPPPWFLSELRLRSGACVVIADDDPSIHAVWSEKLRQFVEGGQIRLESVYSLSELSRVLENPDVADTAHVLVDYEFSGEAEDGLSWLAASAIASRAVLVSSYAEDARIRNRCIEQGVHILPKHVVPYVRVVIV